MLFGLGPALQTSRLVGGSEGPGVGRGMRLTAGRSIRRWHHAIVVTELALAQVLLAGAGLLLASFLASQRVELGFQTEGRIAADLSLAPERYLRPVKEGSSAIDPTRKIQFVNAADFQLATPDYFRALGVTLMRGRSFTDADQATAPPVAIVNQAFARAYFPGDDPMGRRVRFGSDKVHEIVGVVADMRYRFLESPADPTFYLPITQNNERWPFISFTAWTYGDPAALAPALRDAIRQADPNQAITRFNTTLVVAFAVAALLLAAIGAYGVMAYAVSRRTREIGVRAALGASPGDIMRLVFGQAAAQTLVAVAIGMTGSLAATALLKTMLYQITPRDPATFALVAGVLATVALVATWTPARRAARINPVCALREE